MNHLYFYNLILRGHLFNEADRYDKKLAHLWESQAYSELDFP